MDVKFSGPRYTWKNGRVQERLDWSLANFNWFSNFKDGYVEHLNWFKSDHRPVLLRLGQGIERSPHRRFRFIATWVTDGSFKDLIKDNWGNDPSWPTAISSLTKKIQDWNRNVFGNINKRKRDLIRRLNGIDKANPEWTNTFLNQLQEVLWKDYERILLQEENKWIQFGDKNTKFFHTSTQVKKKRNKIKALKDDSGNWISEKEVLKTMVTNVFRDLYSKNDQAFLVFFLLRGLFPKTNPMSLMSFEAKVTYEEIKDVFFRMGALKAPGPDGFHAMFFQTQWDVIGEVY